MDGLQVILVLIIIINLPEYESFGTVHHAGTQKYTDVSEGLVVVHVGVRLHL
jgi:hypothetical protein